MSASGYFVLPLLVLRSLARRRKHFSKAEYFVEGGVLYSGGKDAAVSKMKGIAPYREKDLKVLRIFYLRFFE